MFSKYSNEAKMEVIQSETIGRYYINVLLLKYPDKFSKIFGVLTRAKYTHASIGVSNSDGTFYSYTGKGFRKEFPKQHPTFKKQEVPCKLYQVEVTKEINRKVAPQSKVGRFFYAILYY